jgi:hypothetical protein
VGQLVRQGLTLVLDQFGGATDLDRAVRVLQIEDRDADPRVPGEVAGFRRAAVVEKSTVSPSRRNHTTEDCGPPSGFTVATVAKFLPVQQLPGRLVESDSHGPECRHADAARGSTAGKTPTAGGSVPDRTAFDASA